jgi:prepilin-type N-terminal cleavage/methylation domain-containing protein
MNLKNKKQKGFTLIELLVVISIISLLSSVVLSSLRTARMRAKDTAIKTQLNQMATLINLHFNDAGSFTALQPGWVDALSDCDSMFSGNYVNKAREICRVVYTNSKLNTAWANNFYFGNSTSNSTHWSLNVYLNNDMWYCVGSSGRRGEYDTTGFFTDLDAGCYTNP